MEPLQEFFRMDDRLPSNYGNGLIYGLFSPGIRPSMRSDPRVHQVGTAILIGHGAHTNAETFWLTVRHEIAHYWFDRLCPRGPETDTERVAQAFENASD